MARFYPTRPAMQARTVEMTAGEGSVEVCIGMTRIAVWILEDARRAGGS